MDKAVEAWASYQIRKIAGCACAGNAGNVFPRRLFQRKPLVSDPGMHHGTCVTHVPWCMSGSLTCGDGENVPGIPGACAPANLRIWQEAHVSFTLCGYSCSSHKGFPICIILVNSAGSISVMWFITSCSGLLHYRRFSYKLLKHIHNNQSQAADMGFEDEIDRVSTWSNSQINVIIFFSKSTGYYEQRSCMTVSN